jgi:adenylate cyclase
MPDDARTDDLIPATASEDGADIAEQIVRLGERRYTWPELNRLAGVEHAVADRLWRALGFPDVPPDDPAYTDDDVRALEIATEGLAGLSGAEREEAVELIVREARSASVHLARIAEIQVAGLGELSRLGLRQSALAQLVERGLQDSDLGWLLLYGLRRRLDEVLRRRATPEAEENPELAVGFIDLVDFTQRSGGLDEQELGRLLSRFESLVWDVVTEAGGAVVKLIGDEAMFVSPSADEAARAAIEALDAIAGSELPPARAGLALGPLLARDGDYFGPAVNLASRLEDHASPGTVVVDERFRDALRDGLELEPLGRQSLKGIGEVPAWSLGSANRGDSSGS